MLYANRWRIEAASWRLKDFRRMAIRYDKLAADFASAVARRRHCILVLIEAGSSDAYPSRRGDN